MLKRFDYAPGTRDYEWFEDDTEADLPRDRSVPTGEWRTERCDGYDIFDRRQSCVTPIAHAADWTDAERICDALNRS